jgi:hypothetical protein
MAAYNARFAKPTRNAFDAHRPLRADEDLDAILTWRVLHKVSDSLTLLNDRVIWLLDDTPANRKLIHRYIDVWLVCRRTPRDPRRRAGATLCAVRQARGDRPGRGDGAQASRSCVRVAQAIQAQGDNRRICGSPLRTNPVNACLRMSGTREQRKVTRDNLMC